MSSRREFLRSAPACTAGRLLLPRKAGAQKTGNITDL